MGRYTKNKREALDLGQRNDQKDRPLKTLHSTNLHQVQNGEVCYERHLVTPFVLEEHPKYD